MKYLLYLILLLPAMVRAQQQKLYYFTEYSDSLLGVKDGSGKW